MVRPWVLPCRAAAVMGSTPPALSPPTPPLSCRCGGTLSPPRAAAQQKGRGAGGRAAPPLLPRGRGALAAVAPPGFPTPPFQPLAYPPGVYVGAKPRAGPYPLPPLRPAGFSSTATTFGYGQQ